jgi:hypothetical protein
LLIEEPDPFSILGKEIKSSVRVMNEIASPLTLNAEPVVPTVTIRGKISLPFAVQTEEQQEPTFGSNGHSRKIAVEIEDVKPRPSGFRGID